MKPFKSIIYIFLILTCVLFIFGCEHNEDTDGPKMNIDVLKNAEGITYTVRNGTEQFFFTVGEGEVYEVKMTFNNQSGIVNAYIARDGVKENADYIGNDIPSSNFTVTISKAGTYQIYYECKDYIGKYSYSADKK